MKTLTRIHFLVGICLILPSCSKQKLDLYVKSREVSEQIKAEKFDEAIESSKYILQSAPDSFEARFNYALALSLAKKSDTADQEYQLLQTLLKDPNSSKQEAFSLAFNLGELWGRSQQYDKSLRFYQLALELNPTSKEVKTNIELLIQKQQEDQKGGKGQSDNKDQNKDQNQQQKQDQKKDDKKEESQPDQKNEQKPNEKDSEKKEEDKKYQGNKPYVPRKFSGKDLSESDVKKILGELKRQEEKIRAEYNRRESKEQPRGKDW